MGSYINRWRGDGRVTSNKLGDEVDALFMLPVAEFTGVRNELAARLKREGLTEDSASVKALAKPSVSAWAVNQLYWKHREAFDQLMESSQRLHQAQTSGSADMRQSLDARREALIQLSNHAAELLREAGHNPTADVLHRITTTLEALCVYATTSGGPTPGRLTQDLDPPSFESLVSLIPTGATARRSDKPAKATTSSTSAKSVTKVQQLESPPADVKRARQADEMRRARVAAKKDSWQEARKSLAEARATVQRLEALLKRAHIEAKETDEEAMQAQKRLSDAEERYRKANAAAQAAALRAKQIDVEMKKASKAVEESSRTVEKLSKEIESM